MERLNPEFFNNLGFGSIVVGIICVMIGYLMSKGA